MLRQQKDDTSIQLNCFSPPVMLATFIIEMTLAVYTLWRYKMNVLGRLVITSLVALATFQLCEYHVCGGMGLRAEEWSRFGYVAITLLPPIGLHILHVLADKPRRRLVVTSYVTMAGCIGFFLFTRSAFRGYQCTGNYDIFQIGDRMALLYGFYYYGWLFGAIGLGINWANELKSAGKKAYNRLQSVRGLIIGYLVFLVPTALANTVNPATRRGIPSIMCGFAVLFAIILAVYILPKLGVLRHKQRHADA
jgi:hypothetical protein